MGGDKSVAIIGAGPIGIEAAVRAVDPGPQAAVYSIACGIRIRARWRRAGAGFLGR